MRREWPLTLLGLAMMFLYAPDLGRASGNSKAPTHSPTTSTATTTPAKEGDRCILAPRRLPGGILGDYAAEPRTASGRVDIPRLLEKIKAAHMKMHDFLIWRGKSDWEDFQDFVAQAQKCNCKVWVTLVPPSEPPASQPFGTDYLRWADRIGTLSETSPNIAGIIIDDFWTKQNRQLFTPPYVAKFVSTLHRHNSRLLFLPVIYWSTVGDRSFMKDFGAYIDGIMFPYADLQSAKALPAQLAACRKWLGPDKLLLVNVYATGSSGTGEKGPRSAQYMRDMLRISRENSDGIRIYRLPGADPKDYRFAITAELFGKW